MEDLDGSTTGSARKHRKSAAQLEAGALQADAAAIWPEEEPDRSRAATFTGLTPDETPGSTAT